MRRLYVKKRRRERTPGGKDMRIIICHNGGGARGVMVIVAGYGHGNTSSNPGPD